MLGSPPPARPLPLPPPYMFKTLNGVWFQRLIFTRQSGSSSLCLQDRWVPAPNFYEGGRFQQHTAWLPAPNFHKGLVPAARGVDSSIAFHCARAFQQPTAWLAGHPKNRMPLDEHGGLAIASTPCFSVAVPAQAVACCRAPSASHCICRSPLLSYFPDGRAART